jgi:hypothetical protein
MTLPMRPRHVLLLLMSSTAWLALLPIPAYAVFKCEEKGQISYRDEPCKGGKMLSLPGQETPSNPDRLAAQELAAREKRELTLLEKERRRQEAIEEQEMRKAAKVQASKQKKCRTLALNKKWAEQDAAAATGKSVEKARRNAARKAEKYELACGK